MAQGSDAPHADVVEGKTKKSDDLVKAARRELLVAFGRASVFALARE